jgi:hypothetical protein
MRPHAVAATHTNAIRDRTGSYYYNSEVVVVNADLASACAVLSRIRLRANADDISMTVDLHNPRKQAELLTIYRRNRRAERPITSA